MRDNLVDFVAAFPKALLALETSVEELISSGWDEPLRCRAHDMASALSRAAKDARWWETEAALRPLVVLLELSPRAELAIQDDVRGKLHELLSLLKTYPASRSA